MAEFLAITGGLAAILQLSTAALHLARALHQLASSSARSAATAEITRFANQAESFSNTVEAAQITLRRYCTDHPRSALVRFLEARDVLGSIGAEAEAVRGRLKGVEKRVAGFEAPGRGGGLWVRLWWGWKVKGGVAGIVPEIESVKTGLGLVLVTVQFDAVLRRPRAGEEEEKVREERDALRRVIRRHVETMRRLREELAQARQAVHAHAAAAAATSASPRDDPLMELGRSIYRDGVIPSATTATARTAAGRRRTATAAPGVTILVSNGRGGGPARGQTFGFGGPGVWMG